MVRTMCGVQLIVRKIHNSVMLMLGYEEIYISNNLNKT